MSQSFEDFQDLSETGFQGGSAPETKAPEDEFFHSLYIAGKSRVNHINIKEKSGYLQVRGVEYNLEEVNMVITHTKDILAKLKTENRKEITECFSYKEGNPWVGTSIVNGSPRVCPTTSAERSANSFCNTCKAQIVVAGIMCEENGSPILTQDKKPIFIFLRGKGVKYSNVSNYLNDRFNEDLPPLFEPVTEQTKQFEKSVVNNKRFVVKITKSEVSTQYGNDAAVFELTKGVELPKEAVMKILKLAKDTLSKFNEKFDWSKSKQAKASTTGYGTRPEGILEIGDPVDDANEDKTDKPSSNSTFSFDDIEIV